MNALDSTANNHLRPHRNLSLTYQPTPHLSPRIPLSNLNVRRVFNLARQTVRGYEGYARRIGRRYHDRPCLLEGVMDGLFQIAGADGVITQDELTYLQTVSEAFGR